MYRATQASITTCPETDELRRTIETAAGGPRSAGIEMGAAGPRGLVAWIETQDEIATLFVGGQGRIVLARSLARADALDFGYEGCFARSLAWYGDRLTQVRHEAIVFVYFEPPNESKLRSCKSGR